MKMSFKPSNVLLFGATGQIGSFILDAILSARDKFERVAIFTSQNTVDTKGDLLTQLKKSGVEIIVGDISDEAAVGKAYEGMTLFFSSSKQRRRIHQKRLFSAKIKSSSL
jgi:uncharacterized protein YbjT (DUF2867 family)